MPDHGHELLGSPSGPKRDEDVFRFPNTESGSCAIDQWSGLDPLWLYCDLSTG